ncbi:hypothetical protein MBAV_001894 [Candidatus Magnetobacterium bavaricum]|uniref:Uncharacterized protein n=1 Tax=Candidatus Magnetobacterium bavaricum TaxID=29290 RepID=A0A0F3GZ05_9BACT|nr:hypothetical protein MBAV_001894 [Candidatus Magnetobacterium bavaricum]
MPMTMRFSRAWRPGMGRGSPGPATGYVTRSTLSALPPPARSFWERTATRPPTAGPG